MGIHKEPDEQNYWRQSNSAPAHPIAQFMSRNRYLAIKQYIHFNPRLSINNAAVRRTRDPPENQRAVMEQN